MTSGVPASVSKYCSKMASGGVWGGGIEMAALSHARRVNVHVYQVIHRLMMRLLLSVVMLIAYCFLYITCCVM
jgi:hypothetical protein